MNYKVLQTQYDKIYSYFKNTTEPFDCLEWDGSNLLVWLDGEVIEQYYSLEMLTEVMPI